MLTSEQRTIDACYAILTLPVGRHKDHEYVRRSVCKITSRPAIARSLAEAG